MEKDGMTVNADVFEKLSDAIMFSDENFKKFIKDNFLTSGSLKITEVTALLDSYNKNQMAISLDEINRKLMNIIKDISEIKVRLISISSKKIPS